jgi:hypothetical protein
MKEYWDEDWEGDKEMEKSFGDLLRISQVYSFSV